jgi:hypothetical protein
MRNMSTAVRSHYDDDRYMWAIIIRRFCDKHGAFDVVESSDMRACCNAVI